LTSRDPRYRDVQRYRDDTPGYLSGHILTSGLYPRYRGIPMPRTSRGRAGVPMYMGGSTPHGREGGGHVHGEYSPTKRGPPHVHGEYCPSHGDGLRMSPWGVLLPNETGSPCPIMYSGDIVIYLVGI
jgi:hypothetical protein